jgi:hypothetical protein
VPIFHVGRRQTRAADFHLRVKENNGGLMDPEKIMDGLLREVNTALKAMAKARDLNEKEAHSRIVKNLCESLGVFLNLASEMISSHSNDDEDIPF